jgi:hypothetical protein
MLKRRVPPAVPGIMVRMPIFIRNLKWYTLFLVYFSPLFLPCEIESLRF